jgi:hypothetical protein
VKRTALVGTTVLIAAAFLHATLGWIELRPAARGLNGDEVTYLERAEALRGGPAPADVLLWPPLYPRFLAAAGWLLGSPVRGAQAVQLVLLLAAAALLAGVARRLGLRPATSVACGGFLLVYPPVAAFAWYLWPEVVHLVLFLAVLWLLVARGDSLRWMLAAGALLGLALLTKSLLLPFWPLLFLPLFLDDREESSPATGRRRRLLRTAVAVAVAAAVLAVTVAPTLAANHRRTGRWLLAGSGTFNLWVGLNDRSRKSLEDPVVWPAYQEYLASADSWVERQEVLHREIRELVAERGVPGLLADQLSRQYFRLFDKDSYLTEQLPGGALAVGPRGYRDPPPPVAAALRAASYLPYALLLVLAAAGVALGTKSLPSAASPPRRRWWWLLLAFVGYNLALFLLLHVKSRYRVQLLPALLLFAGLGWDTLAGAVSGTVRPLPRGRVALAAALAVALLFLAFGGAAVEARPASAPLTPPPPRPRGARADAGGPGRAWRSPARRPRGRSWRSTGGGSGRRGDGPGGRRPGRG